MHTLLLLLYNIMPLV